MHLSLLESSCWEKGGPLCIELNKQSVYREQIVQSTTGSFKQYSWKQESSSAFYLYVIMVFFQGAAAISTKESFLVKAQLFPYSYTLIMPNEMCNIIKTNCCSILSDTV